MAEFDFRYPGFAGYSLQDDEGEEKKRRSLEALQDLYPRTVLDPTVAPAAPEPAPRSYTSPLDQLGKLRQITPEDQAMMNKWRTAEDAALTRSGYLGNHGYGIGEAIRDAAPLLLGGALDVAFNKGKGLPTLTAGAAQAAAQQEKIRNDQEQQAGSFALSARGQREALQRGRLGELTEMRQQLSFDLNNNPDADAANQYRDSLVKNGVPRQMVEGLTYNQMKQNTAAYTPYFKHNASDLTAADAGKVSKSRRQGTLSANDEHFGTEYQQETQLAAGKAAAGERGRTGVELEMAPLTTQVAADKAAAVAEAQANARKPVTSKDVITNNPMVQWKSAESLDNYLKDTKANQMINEGLGVAQGAQAIYTNMLTAIDEMNALPAYKRFNPLDEDRARILANMETHVSEFQGMVAQVAGGGNQKLQEEVRALSPNIIYDPRARARVEGFKHGFEGMITRKLGPYGGTMHLTDPRDAGAHAQPEPASQPSAPARKPSAPKQPSAAQAKPYMGMTAVKNPDGTITISDGQRTKKAPASFLQAFIDGGGAVR